MGRAGHMAPFIERLTRAHPGFEVKDAARRLRRSIILEFKVRMRFSAAVRSMDCSAQTRLIGTQHEERGPETPSLDPEIIA
jgi:hypothetical protein